VEGSVLNFRMRSVPGAVATGVTSMASSTRASVTTRSLRLAVLTPSP